MKIGAWLKSDEASISLLAIGLRDRAVAEVVAVDLAARAEHTLGQFEPRHFQADEQHAVLVAHRDVLGDRRGQRRFAHTGTGGEDDQFGVVQAAGLVVEIASGRSRCRRCRRRA